MKSVRLKKRSNPWITHDIIKLMYERDHVHAKATQGNGSKLWQDYHNLRNKVTGIIKERKNSYFNDIHALGRDDPKKRWPENDWCLVKINTRILLVTFLRMISIIILPILATKWTQNFKIKMTFFSGKAQKVFIVFVSRGCLVPIL